MNILLNRARHSTSDGSESVEPADWTAANIPTKDDLIDRIFWEHAFEMTGEQHEWWDTHRMGATWLGQHVTSKANEFLFRPEQDDFGSNSDGHRRYYYGLATHGEGKIYPE